MAQRNGDEDEKDNEVCVCAELLKILDVSELVFAQNR